MKLITILGGAGYIGSHLIKILLDNNMKVNILDKLVFGASHLKTFQLNPQMYSQKH